MRGTKQSWGAGSQEGVLPGFMKKRQHIDFLLLYVEIKITERI
jgi:hypothetical protein